MKNTRWGAALLVLGLAALNAHAEVSQVRLWAAACANCHGTFGQAQEGMKSLAGKKEGELLQKLLDFKAGRRPATLMHQIAHGYSDEQLQQLAAYFSALKP